MSTDLRQALSALTSSRLWYSRRWITLLAAIASSACGDGAAPAPSASASAAARPTPTSSGAASASAPATAAWCGALGGQGDGSIGAPCAVKSAPFEVTITDRYSDAIDGRVCIIKNTSTEAWTFGGVKGFYYKDGKLIAAQPTNKPSLAEVFSHSGNDFQVGAGATVELECGWQRADEPPGATLEVEVYTWGRDEPEDRYFTRDLGGKTWEQRPKGGF